MIKFIRVEPGYFIPNVGLEKHFIHLQVMKTVTLWKKIHNGFKGGIGYLRRH